MNEARRKALQSVITGLRALQAPLDTCIEEEQEYYDNMPEGLQGGEKGELAQDAINNMEQARSELEQAVDNLESVLSQ